MAKVPKFTEKQMARRVSLLGIKRVRQQDRLAQKTVASSHLTEAEKVKSLTRQTVKRVKEDKAAAARAKRDRGAAALSKSRRQRGPNPGRKDKNGTTFE